jgi:hypothetical protein
MSWITALAPEARIPYCRPQGLWTRGDVMRLVICVFLGSAGLAAAWRGSAGEADWQDNSRWILLGSGSVALGVAGIILWLVAGRSRIVASRRVVGATLARRVKAEAHSPEGPAAPTVVTAVGMRRFHRADCLLMVGKRPQHVDLDTTHLRACEVCAS